MTLEHLFTPFPIGSFRLKNRIVALPLYTGYAYPDGRVSPFMIEHYWNIARSGAALVVIGNAAVSGDGASAACNLRVDDDRFIPGLGLLARAIRTAGAFSCLQLNHGGPFAKNGRPMVPSPMSGATITHDISSLRAFMETFPIRERFGLTRQLMEMVYRWQQAIEPTERGRITEDFASAARRAWQAGFDMVELHGGTGYLLASFFSAYMNRISFGYGGSPEARARFPLEVLGKVRERLPADFPVGFRLMVREWVPGGVEPEEASTHARLLEEAGAAYFSVSAGTYTSMFKPDVMRLTARPAHLGRDAARIREAVNRPVIIAGRVFTPRVAEKVLREGRADLVGLARPLLADHGWPQKARSGAKITVCINCNTCLKRVVLDTGVACERWPDPKKDRVDLETSILSRNLINGLVVISGRKDMAVVRENWERLFPVKEDLHIRFLILKDPQSDDPGDAAIEGFRQWVEKIPEMSGISHGKAQCAVRYVNGNPEDVVLEDAEQNDSGVLILALRPGKSWRRRLAERHRTGVISFIGSHHNPNRVLVPVDLSSSSLLLLRVINDAYYRKSRFDFSFVHVADRPKNEVMRRWSEILDILGWDPGTPLTTLSPKSIVADDILEAIHSGNYGSVILGRRRITPVRRWFIGSVSAGILESLTDQNITLVG